MKTIYEMPEDMRERFLAFEEAMIIKTPVYPVNFIKKMQKNIGVVNDLHIDGSTDDGLERKNPLIVALGDSVTAGHFEFVERSVPFNLKAIVESGEPIEITDARQVYHEKLRMMLIDYFEQTSISVINSGIAGDTIIGMSKRLERDVLRYQPDLVLINGSLNWGEACGAVENFKKELKYIVKRIKDNTEADIVLMTPNMDAPHPIFNPGTTTLPERVRMIREVAYEEGVCLSDAYAVWEGFAKEGNDPAIMLANHVNHPTVTGHEIYARVLIRLIKEGI